MAKPKFTPPPSQANLLSEEDAKRLDAALNLYEARMLLAENGHTQATWGFALCALAKAKRAQ